ncbi:zinc finger protein 134-like [Hydractinia symbiolongicarpus]|uniref:zinc finger protein 134-like n=1 Tax=Hydractinia symbiolongicarpus TaxID=13093 RepID=UPI00254C5BEE|nr:zinc finger protein 134-like [Hydractinia symbiolongicarpus]
MISLNKISNNGIPATTQNKQNGRQLKMCVLNPYPVKTIKLPATYRLLINSEGQYILSPVTEESVKMSQSCKFCLRSFLSLHQLLRHVQLTHKVIKVVTCPVCRRSHESSNSFYKHYVLKHACKYTENKGSSKDETKNRGERKIRLPKRFQKQYVEDFLSEYKVVCNDNKNSSQTSNSSGIHHEKLTRGKRFQCLECPEVFWEAQKFKRHIVDKHSTTKTFTCEVCNEVFVSSGKFKQHCKQHGISRPFKCQQCGNRFAYEGVLKVHYRSHNDERPYQCKHCDRAFSQKSTLSSHMQRHTGETPHVCDVCGRAFAIKGDLRTHSRIHSCDKPFSCETCGRSFPRKSNYLRHMRKHTGEKPFACQYCPKRFSRSEKCAEHERSHTNERPFSCEDCGARFSCSGNFSKHRKLHKDGKYVRKRATSYRATSVIKRRVIETNESHNTPLIEKHTDDTKHTFLTKTIATQDDEHVDEPMFINICRQPTEKIKQEISHEVDTACISEPTNPPITGQFISLTSDDMKSSHDQFITLTGTDGRVASDDFKFVNLISGENFEPVCVNTSNIITLPDHVEGLQANLVHNQAYLMLDSYPSDSFAQDGCLTIQNPSLFLHSTTEVHTENFSYELSSAENGLTSSVMHQHDSSFFTPRSPLPSENELICAELDVKQTLDTNTFLNDDYFKNSGTLST